MLSSVKLLNRWELYLARSVNIFGYLEIFDGRARNRRESNLTMAPLRWTARKFP
jgi:hypothetical protein